MRPHSSVRKRRKPTSEDEAGFTVVEMVIAIPIVFLVLGLVLTSVGVTVGLMGDITKSAGASRVASATVDKLGAARNCVEVRSIITSASASTYDSKYQLSFGSYTCSANSSFPLTINVKDKVKSKLYYTKSLTLAAF